MKYIQMGKEVLLDLEEYICTLTSDTTRVALVS